MSLHQTLELRVLSILTLTFLIQLSTNALPCLCCSCWRPTQSRATVPSRLGAGAGRAQALTGFLDSVTTHGHGRRAVDIRLDAKVGVDADRLAAGS